MLTGESQWQLADDQTSFPVFDPFLSVWSDDDWLKKFSGKTLEENKEEEGSEPPKVEAQEVRLKPVLLEERLVLSIGDWFFFFFFFSFCGNLQMYVQKQRE